MPNIAQIFKCPQCGDRRLEEVMGDVTVSSVIESLDEGGDTVYGEQTNEDGHTERFQCIGCGWEIPGLTTTAEVYEYLTEPGCPCHPDTKPNES